ncbi:Hypothetical predicted protein [Podarcis lilfordi]|uniref:Uncharacterized protein n=1 Tax=Podarcis lilfordi TaxID=74358 RepID=A0AA35LL50_9SAUR|nr:Hypothetical predicted protein [Podarcis lilfordi]
MKALLGATLQLLKPLHVPPPLLQLSPAPAGSRSQPRGFRSSLPWLIPFV